MSGILAIDPHIADSKINEHGQYDIRNKEHIEGKDNGKDDAHVLGIVKKERETTCLSGIIKNKPMVEHSVNSKNKQKIAIKPAA